MNVFGGKQVSPIYYMVKDVEVLSQIVYQQAIRTSIKAEPRGTGKGSYHYVSVDWYDWCDTEFTMAINSDSAEEYKQKYRAWMKKLCGI